jgi:hypothetical protein
LAIDIEGNVFFTSKQYRQQRNTGIRSSIPFVHRIFHKFSRVSRKAVTRKIIIESYTESNESLKITRLRNPIVCFGLLLKQTQAYIYIRLIASGIDKIHNCPKCLKEKHFPKATAKYRYSLFDTFRTPHLS